MRQITTVIVFLTVCFSLVSCSHQLKIKNLQRYNTSPHFSASDRLINIGITPYNGNIDQRYFYDAIVDKLSSRPYVGQVQSNYHPNKIAAIGVDFQPDCVLSIEPEVEFHGSGWNYPICFPGFLIFTHAWNGYVYRADISTKISIYDNSGNAIDTMKIDTPYNFRHCDFGRGFWSASGWWMPGLGATALVSGFFMIQYDDDATDELLQRIKENYSTYVVERIYNNANFGTIMSSAKQAVSLEEKTQMGNDLDALEIRLNKLKEMQSQGLINEAEFKSLREKAILE